MQDREEIKQLFIRYREGKCSFQEKQKLHAWFNAYASREATGLDELVKSYEAGEVLANKSRRRFWPAIAAAAMIFIAGGAALWQYSEKHQTETISTSVVPGGNKASLTLADGRTIILNEDQSGITIHDRRISYDSGTGITNLSSALELPENFELVLTTPNGGTYQVTLSDGTKVWLNAGSKLRYPLKFEAEKRVVYVEGEVYIDVANIFKKGSSSEKIPFIVESKGQQIEVLGTEFNVSAYREESAVKTTLVEGKVRLKDLRNTTGIGLLPGEQGIYKNTGFTKHVVNTEQYTAWKNGEFHFDNTPLSEMMKQVGRWFDIQIIYEGEPPAEEFSGVMSRNVSLETLLEFLRLSEVKYRLENRNLIIE